MKNPQNAMAVCQITPSIFQLISGIRSSIFDTQQGVHTWHLDPDSRKTWRAEKSIEIPERNGAWKMEKKSFFNME